MDTHLKLVSQLISFTKYGAAKRKRPFMTYNQDIDLNTCVFASGLQIIAKSEYLLRTLHGDLKNAILTSTRAEDVMSREDFKLILCETNHCGETVRFDEGLLMDDIIDPHHTRRSCETNMKQVWQYAFCFFRSIFPKHNFIATKRLDFISRLKFGINIIYKDRR
jgi:hypothetical protein